MKKIVLFNKTIMSGGIEKCIENLVKNLHDKYEFEVYYFDDTIVDPNVVNLISKYAKVSKIEDAPVEVNVAVSGLGAPYSTGFRNCFSLVKLWDDTVTIAFFIFLLSINEDAIMIASILVEHAPYIPRKLLLLFWESDSS